ncbi:MAG: peroxiredoxin [Patescibacteria group bacterium]
MENSELKRIPLIGEKFPPIGIQTTRGRMTLPDDFHGQWFVLFSHPADFTPVCTTEFSAFASRYEEFKNINTELIGLSIDQVFSHIKWLEWMRENINTSVEFPVIADHAGKLAHALGMVHPRKGYNTVRAVFVVDPEGTIRLMLYYPQEVGRNIDEILRAVKALQLADKHNIATPANWPHNEIVGDHVIIPPATDVLEAEKRLQPDENAKCYDWWFCTKKIEE